jgi:PAS domain S-box-containing protein
MIDPLPRLRASWVAQACAWATFGIPVADLGLWWAVRAGWTGYGRIFPVSPSTALVFLLLSSALILWIRLPDRLWVRRFALVAAGFAALVALYTLFCHLTGGVPSWEFWLRSVETSVRSPEVGGMSVPTAEMLLLTSFGFATQLFRRRENAYLQRAGTVAAMVACFAGLLGVMISVAGVPLYENQQFEVILPVRMLECTLFGFALLTTDSVANRLRNWFLGGDAAGPGSAPISREELRWLWLLSAVGIVALTAGAGYLHIVRTHFQIQTIEALRTMSDLKAVQIEQWRHERLGDARTLMRVPGLGENLSAISGPSPTAARAKFVGWLQALIKDYGYANVVVFDSKMRPVLSEPGGVDFLSPGLRARLIDLRPGADVVELPPYVDGAGRLHWDLLVPLPENGSAAVEGAILLQTAPAQFIVPVLQSWPTEYPSGQSMLWYRDGDRLMSLGGYRPVPGTTPDELRPFGMIRDISSLGPQSMLTRVARGDLNANEGLDHRGIMIIGIGRPVANSPWLLSSRVDSAEVYAPLRRTAFSTAGVVAGLFLTTGFATSWLWRQRQKNLLHERLSAELEQKRLAARLGMVMRHAKDIIFVTDEQRRLVDANQQAVDTYGWTKEELLRMTIVDFRAPETLKELPSALNLFNSAEGALYETVHRRKDGTTFPVEVGLRRVEIEGQWQVLSIIRDITERKRTEAAVRESEAALKEAQSLAHIGSSVWDARTDKTTWSDELFRIVGWDPAKPPPTHEERRRLYTPESFAILDRAVKRTLATGEPYDLQLQIVRPDGARRDVHTRGTCSRNESGGIIGLHGTLQDITERKQAAERLEMLKLSIDSHFDSAYWMDTDNRFVYVNDTACKTLGYTREELLGQSVSLVSPGITPQHLQGVWNRLRETGIFSREAVHRCKDGREFPVEIVASLVRLEGKEFNCGFARDITDRKRAEAALHASEERYRLIAENTSDVIWLHDLATDQLSYVSPSVFSHRGFRPEEVIGQKIGNSLSPEGAVKVRRLLEEGLAAHAAGDRSRRSAVIEVEQKRKDGSFVPTEIVASLLSDSTGRPTHVLGISRDITERRRARETLEKFNLELEGRVNLRTAELAARNSEIQALLDSIPDTVLLCDGSGAVISSHSPAGGEVAIQSADTLGPDSYDPVVLEIAKEMHAVAPSGKQTVVRDFDRTLNGFLVSIEARATPAGPDRLLILLRDISARKQMERDISANLERERQLSEMKTQFISVASHEFRTPLAAATGSLELLERHAARITEAKRVELLTRAQRSLGRLTTIMDNVLQLSRAESGRVMVKRMKVDLVQIVQDLIREVDAGDRHSHTFAFQPSGKGGAVPVDTNLFNHILSNLLGNAVRYSPTGTKISVTLEIAEQAFSLTVADEGIGIPEAERERIFEPFARGSNVGQINGTGLGLNIVKRYAELMGGHIELLPTERGAAFRVMIPLA